MYQYRWTLWGTRGNVVMVHIVPISPPLFFRPPKFIVWVVSWYFDFCHLRVKKIKERFRTDIPEITLKRTDKSYSPLYSLSPDYVVGRSCRTDPAPFLGFRQIPAYKSIVPLQGFEPCFVPRLSMIKDWALWLIPSDVCHQRLNGDFSLPWNYPLKTWLRIKDEHNTWATASLIFYEKY